MYLLNTKPFHDELKFKTFTKQLFFTGVCENNVTLLMQIIIAMISSNETKYLVPIADNF